MKKSFVILFVFILLVFTACRTDKNADVKVINGDNIQYLLPFMDIDFVNVKVGDTLRESQDFYPIRNNTCRGKFWLAYQGKEFVVKEIIKTKDADTKITFQQLK